ncbi:MAG: low affinity iron permease family protein [Pirellulales bacterium]
MNFQAMFRRFAKWTAWTSGHPVAFLSAVALILVWALTGPLFHYSDTWQLVINTSTTIITFLMVFVIQNSQNRDSVAMQIKLDELIRAVAGARNDLLDLEELDECEIEKLRSHFEMMAVHARTKLEHRQGNCSQREERALQPSDLPD